MVSATDTQTQQTRQGRIRTPPQSVSDGRSYGQVGSLKQRISDPILRSIEDKPIPAGPRMALIMAEVQARREEQERQHQADIVAAHKLRLAAMGVGQLPKRARKATKRVLEQEPALSEAEANRIAQAEFQARQVTRLMQNNGGDKLGSEV